MPPSELPFHERVDLVQQQIEDVFDGSDLDIDLENSDGVLTLRFPNGTQVILSRQPALAELWVAARSGGFHLHYQEDSQRWFCQSTQESLGHLLARVVQEQSGTVLNFPLP